MKSVSENKNLCYLRNQRMKKSNIHQENVARHVPTRFHLEHRDAETQRNNKLKIRKIRFICV